MHINKINLRYYRGAQDLAVDLHPRLNVFYGENGAGKSTLLDAAAIMLSWVVSRIRHAGTSGRPIQEEDISNGQSLASLSLSCIADNRSVDWKLIKTRKGHSRHKESSELSDLTNYVEELRDAIGTTSEKVNLPLFAYYPVNRAVLDIPLRIRDKHSFTLLTAYDEALTGGASFRAFFEWYREREDLENEVRRDSVSTLEGKNTLLPDSQLEAVRKALTQLMPEFKNLAVRRNPLRMEVDKNGKRLTVNQLSDGEKCLMAMVGDLARRMAIANPMRENPFEGEGVVLIDEIDLHLHPKWQRMIVPKLIELFPNCQFIVSTHSPHVITHVQVESLYLLKQTEKGFVDEQPTESYGKNVDRILEDLMGLETTRPDQVNQHLHNLFIEIDKGQLSEARLTIAKMKAEIGDDPDLVKAEVLIKRREILGK